MKNYKMMITSAGWVALSTLGCAAPPQQTVASPRNVAMAQVVSEQACAEPNQNMRPQWKPTATRSSSADAIWHPEVRKADPSHEVAVHTFRPGLRETNLASASCLEDGPRTY